MPPSSIPQFLYSPNPNHKRQVEVIEVTAVPRNVIRGTISGKPPRQELTTRLPQLFLQTSREFGFAVFEDGPFEPQLTQENVPRFALPRDYRN